MAKKQAPPAARAGDRSVDLLVVGSGTGMAAALAAHELGLSTLIVVLTEYGKSRDPLPAAREYIHSVVEDTAPSERGLSFLEHGPATVEMLSRTTPLKFFWAKGYSDYHPEQPGGRADGRTCESRPFDLRVLGRERGRLRPGVMEASVPMPVTGADYKWFNLMVRKPVRAIPKIMRRAALGIGGMVLGREYAAGGQALAAGMYAGVLNAGIPVWTETSLVGLLQSAGGRVTGAVVRQDGRDLTIDVRCGVILAAGGFDHNVEWRRKYQSSALLDNASLGAEGNTGDAIALSQQLGARLALMDQAWWFPAFAPLPGEEPMVMLAERSLPGSFVVDQTGRRFINESVDYMSFGQEVLRRENAGSPVSAMWMIFDQKYRNSYIMAGGLFPGQPIPQEWYDAGIACRAESIGELASLIDVPTEALEATFKSFGDAARIGTDPQFGRGDSAYDRYYGDPTITPNPNLRALEGTLFAVKMVLSDLGTCGGVTADAAGRVVGEDGAVIDGLYAIGNTAANAFGATYPGAGATIGQGLVYGYVAAHHAASTLDHTAVGA